MEQKERKLRPITKEDVERILNSYNLAECSGSGSGSGSGNDSEQVLSNHPYKGIYFDASVSKNYGVAKQTNRYENNVAYCFRSGIVCCVRK